MQKRVALVKLNVLYNIIQCSFSYRIDGSSGGERIIFVGLRKI